MRIVRLLAIGFFAALIRADVAAQAGLTPTDVHVVVSPDGTTLGVSWTPAATPPARSGHQLVFRALPADAVVAVVTTGAEPGFTTAIPPGTSGTFSVAVAAIAGTIGLPSAPAVFVIGGSQSCTGPPEPPAHLRFTRVGGQLEMSWNPAAGASEYLVEAGRVSDGTDIYVGSAGMATSLTASIAENLHAFVRVRARNACGTSPRGNEIEIGAMWSVAFRPGLDPSPCGLTAPGGFCSQIIIQRTLGAFDEIWSPGTPVMRVRGSFSATQVTASVQCTTTGATGSLQAAWNGERYEGTATLGGNTTSVRITAGNFDPQCEQP